ncbi:MAG TPA: PAS domain S-box protein [Terracidiphilus sp.]|jgi:PAS domain S-box-containing protein
MDPREARQLKEREENPSPPIWSSLSVLAVAMAAGGILARLEAGPAYDWLLLMTAMGLTAAVLMRVLADNAADSEARTRNFGDPLRDILDSAGTLMISVGLDGKIAYMNPAAERLLGYHAAELVDKESTDKLLAPGEENRLVSEVHRLYGLNKTLEGGQSGSLASYAEVVHSLAPSQVPSFETHLLRKDGGLFPVRLHISTLRNRDGLPIGLVAVGLDQSANAGPGAALRIPRDRYRDLFENSSEMIATLDMSGKFLYANPAWRQTFRLDRNAPLEQASFADIFGSNCRDEVAGLLRKTLDGVTIDRAPIRTETADGRVLELEMSLHQRRRAGKPLAVQCLLHDVTQQKQREHRLALQLVVSQIVGENVSAEIATKRVLEALCISQGWDVAVKWDVNAEENRLEFNTAWGVQGKDAEGLIQESMGITLTPGGSLPGRAWKEGRLVWASDLTGLTTSPRVHSAIRSKMVSGWAAPVQVGNHVLAVLEFYCHARIREDRETTAAMETVAGSLAQMLARTRERERAEELSRQQEILLGSVADGICGVDRNGLVRFANPAAARLLGARPQNLIGKPVHQLVHGAAPPDKKCAEDCPLRRASGQRKAVTGEGTIFRSNGTGFPAEFFLNPILDQGRFSGSVLSFRDISQRYALDRMKDEFVSTVSHELRTPLTSIRGALGLLSSGMLGVINEKAANLLRIALSNSERLVRLINDILDLERTQSGREPLAFRPVQLGEIVRQAIDGVQPMADEAGVLLIHDKTQVEVTADTDRLLQVITNLLSNAIKFSPANSAISVMLRSGASGVTLSVIDQGRGIPADKLEAIFGRFQQVDASDSRQKGGSGLGLAICRAIVLQHSGRIWAERNPVRGSTFRVFLPYQPIAAKAEENTTTPAMHGAVLVADTHGTTRPLIADQLARFGYRVVEASTVDQAVAVAHDGVSAIVLDTTLDGINGWEILPILRREDPEARTPVVLLGVATSQQQGENNRKVDRLFPRPTDDSLLDEVVKSLCATGEQARFLIVEDDPDVGQVIGEIFAREHITVRVAHTRQSALDECLSFQPHMIVLDIGMPNGDGFNVIDWLRQHEDLNRVPLVAYSAHGLTQAERMQLVLGLSHFLTKASVEPEQLEALVLTMLRSSQEAEESLPEVSAGQGS